MKAKIFLTLIKYHLERITSTNMCFKDFFGLPRFFTQTERQCFNVDIEIVVFFRISNPFFCETLAEHLLKSSIFLLSEFEGYLVILLYYII